MGTEYHLPEHIEHILTIMDRLLAMSDGLDGASVELKALMATYEKLEARLVVETDQMIAKLITQNL